MNAPSLDRDALEGRLLDRLSKANKAFGLIAPGDKIMVALSGGKDSWAMLYLLQAYRRRVPFDFSLVAVNLDQGHPGFPVEILRDHLAAEGFDHHIVYKDTHTVVKEKTPEGKTFCALCSRMRRGILHETARELGCRSIALGHHRDDVAQTLLLNVFFSGRMRGMPARLEGPVAVIRPLVYCAESDLAAYCEAVGAPILPCNLCGSQENLQRQEMKALLNTLEARHPQIKGNMLAALNGAGLMTEGGDPDATLAALGLQPPSAEAADGPLIQIESPS